MLQHKRHDYNKILLSQWKNSYAKAYWNTIDAENPSGFPAIR